MRRDPTIQRPLPGHGIQSHQSHYIPSGPKALHQPPYNQCCGQRVLSASLGQYITDHTRAPVILVPRTDDVVLVGLHDESVFKLVKLQAGKFLQKRFADARNQLAPPLWLAEEICCQLLEFLSSPEVQTPSVETKVNRATNPEAIATVYLGGRHPLGSTSTRWRHNSDTQVIQIEVFEKVYKKKEDDQWSGPRAMEVARQHNNNEEPPLSSQGFVALNNRKRGRVFGLNFEAHHSVVGSLAQPFDCSIALAATAAMPRPRKSAPKPPADTRHSTATTNNDEHAATGG
ncbi:UNVERIFIED_CONTAM: hypothetical protein Sindi_0292000 [Sesamum indicum]